MHDHFDLRRCTRKVCPADHGEGRVEDLALAFGSADAAAGRAGVHGATLPKVTYSW